MQGADVIYGPEEFQNGKGKGSRVKVTLGGTPFLILDRSFEFAMPGLLGFTRRERRALLASGLIAVTSILVSLLWRGEPLTLILSNAEREMLEQGIGMPSEPRVLEKRAKEAYASRKEQANVQEFLPAPAPFDPNTSSEEAMRSAGMPPRLAATIIRYREKGGRFRKPEDLLKIYGMSDSVFSRIALWVAIPETAEKYPADKPLTVEVNSADEKTFALLPGIGSGYASRICRFRNALGGFHSLEQVAETFGLPDSVYQKIRPRLTLQANLIPLEINVLSAHSLARHPYISPKQAKVLVNYRTNHGNFRTLVDLEKTKVFTTTDIQRLAPYLKDVLSD